MSKSKYTFSLIGVNLEKVDQKYGISTSCSTTEEDSNPEKTTKIDELEINKKIPEVISFLDESKRLRKCVISMIDYSTNRIVDRKGRYKCYWDKNTIPEGFQPIGCPIKYIPNKVTKTYHSEITKDLYTISESVTEKRQKEIDEKNDDRLKSNIKGYYETDGIFCSFNCCMAYIDSIENRNNPLYQYSESLLLTMYNDVNETETITEIMPAPHWRTLIDFGGHLTIEKFRESFNKVKYIDHGILSYVSLGRLFEDKIKF
jgi:hypothetical protein